MLLDSTSKQSSSACSTAPDKRSHSLALPWPSDAQSLRDLLFLTTASTPCYNIMAVYSHLSMANHTVLRNEKWNRQGMNEASTLIDHPFICSGHRRPLSHCSICRARRMVSDRVILSPHRSPGPLVCKTCCQVATQLGPNSCNSTSPWLLGKNVRSSGVLCKIFLADQTGWFELLVPWMSPCRLHKVLEGPPLPNSCNHIGFKLQLLWLTKSFSSHMNSVLKFFFWGQSQDSAVHVLVVKSLKFNKITPWSY